MFLSDFCVARSVAYPARVVLNIHLSYFRNLECGKVILSIFSCPFKHYAYLEFVFSVLICSSSLLSLLYPSIRVRTAPPVSVRVRVRLVLVLRFYALNLINS